MSTLLARCIRTVAWRAIITCSVIAQPSVSCAQALPGVSLQWSGPQGCRDGSGVREAAQALLGASYTANDAVAADVELAALPERGLQLRYAARSPAGEVKRELTVASCEEAKQAAALLLALTLDPEARAEPKAVEPEVTPPPVAAVPAYSAPRAPLPHDVPAGKHTGVTFALATGVDPSSLSAPAGVLTARVGARWSAFTLEAEGNHWQPLRTQRVAGVDVAVHMLEVDARACRSLITSGLELAPCAGLSFAQMHAELNARDAGGATWVRSFVGARLSLWLSNRLAADLTADALLALNRPRFSSVDGSAAHTPAAGFVARLGVSYVLGASQ